MFYIMEIELKIQFNSIQFYNTWLNIHEHVKQSRWNPYATPWTSFALFWINNKLHDNWIKKQKEDQKGKPW